jgi:hypothetical protein
VQVECRRYEKYGIVIRRFEDMKEGDVLQTASFESEGKDQFQYELLYDPADKAYAGIARVDIYGYPEGTENGNQLYSTILLVTNSAD